MTVWRRIGTAGCVALVAGCSAIPGIDVGYYLPRTSLVVTLTQTAACVNQVPYLKSDLIYTALTEADVSKAYHIPLGKLSSFYSGTDLSFKFSDDGRLKSINSSQTGNGQGILKAAFSTLPLIFGAKDAGVVDQASMASSFATATIAAACAKIDSIVGAGKPLSVVTKALIPFESAGGSVAFAQTTYDEATWKLLNPIFGTASAAYTMSKPPDKPQSTLAQGAVNTSAEPIVHESRYVPLTLRLPGSSRVTVAVNSQLYVERFEQTVLVPQYGREYDLVIPTAILWGTNHFSLVLSDAGTVTELRYGNVNGVENALATVSAVDAVLADGGLSAQTAQMKAEADNIAAQQRLIVCRTTPDICK